MQEDLTAMGGTIPQLGILTYAYGEREQHGVVVLCFLAAGTM